MKHLFVKILIALSILTFSWIVTVWNTYAADWDGITVITTEKVPGANCKPEKLDDNRNPLTYTCTAAKGFGSVILMMGRMIKYFTYIAGLGWVLFIIVNGIMYSMWWVDPQLKDNAKKRIMWTLIGLILLFLSWVILNLIAPWVYK